MPSNQFLARAFPTQKPIRAPSTIAGENFVIKHVEVWKLRIRIGKQSYTSEKEYKTGALASSAAKRFMERMNETASY